MSNPVEDFISSPSEALLDSCRKDQLFKTADHYGIETEDKWLKDTVRETFKTKLRGYDILIEKQDVAVSEPLKLSVAIGSSLTFEQQERLLLLQLEQ